MTMGGPSTSPNYRIVVKKDTGMYHLQQRKFFGWTSINSSSDIDKLRDHLEELKRDGKDYVVIEEFLI